MKELKILLLGPGLTKEDREEKECEVGSEDTIF